LSAKVKIRPVDPRGALKPEQEIGAGMTQDADFDADLARYPRRPFFKEQSVWAIFVYRFGRRVLKQKPGLTQYVSLKIYWIMFRIVETLTKISLPLNASIGAGLRIYDLGMIFIHSDSIIGRNCTIRHGVTVGNTKEDGRVPVIGDHVELGAYAQILGGVHIGDGAKVGPLSVVLDDVPPGATAIGIPARILPGVWANQMGSSAQ
jgi:serine O-acetyltransferase